MNQQELRLVRALIDNLASIRQEIQAIRVNQEATEQNRKNQPVRPMLIELEPDSRIPIPIGEHYETENRARHSERRKARTVLEILGIVAGIAYAIVTYFQWQDFRESVLLDQRAWIGPIGMSDPQFSENGQSVYLKEGNTSTFVTSISNTGKTPSALGSIRSSFRVLPRGAKFTPRYPEAARNLGPIWPGHAVRLVSPQTEVMGNIALQAYKSGSSVLYVFGEIVYPDVFKKIHTTRFCVYLVPNLAGFTDCDTYNEIN